MVCGGQTSRLEVARELVKILNKESDVKISEVSSDYFNNIYFAERPRCERLINTKLEIRNLNIMRDWKVALKEYIEDYYQNYLE